MNRPQYHDQCDEIPCPYCEEPIDMGYVLNRGGDFEGAFLLAHPGVVPCPHCGELITPEPNLEWRIWKPEDYNKYRRLWSSHSSTPKVKSNE